MREREHLIQSVFAFSFRPHLSHRRVRLEGVTETAECRLQVRVGGGCFTVAETTQTFINANTRPKKIIFKPKVSIFEKVWVVSVMVKQWPASLTCKLHFTLSDVRHFGYLHSLFNTKKPSHFYFNITIVVTCLRFFTQN